MPTVKLTVEEANMLDVLTHRTKMDCWFWIDDDLNVRDLEEDEKLMDTKEAVLMVDDGITNINDYGLTAEQISCYNNLIQRLKSYD